MQTIPRRTFLASAALPLAGLPLAGLPPAGRALAGDDLEVIDTHTHFYDPARPEGVPWPGKDDRVLYRRVLPPEFFRLAGPHGVRSTVVVEASPWVEDNQWLLDLAAREKGIVGVVGRLDPAAEGFAALLARFARNPLYRGIRIGHAELRKGLDRRGFLDNLRALAKQGCELDVNGGPDMPADVARLARSLPDLRIVINHAANPRLDGKAMPADWLAGMRAAAGGKNVYCKVSALAEATGRTKRDAPAEVAFYRPVLDGLWDCFGADRLLYGSNWPVSDRAADYGRLFGVVKAYFGEKGAGASAKFFRGNALRAYGR